MKLLGIIMLSISALFVSCSIGNESRIKNGWQNIIKSETEAEEKKNIVYFHEKCMRGVSISFDIKDMEGNLHPYNGYNLTESSKFLSENDSVRLIALDGEEEICKTNFWKPKNIDNFYYLFLE